MRVSEESAMLNHEIAIQICTENVMAHCTVPLALKNKPLATTPCNRPHMHMVGIELQMINRPFFFRHLKGRCHGNQFSGKMGQNYLPPCTVLILYYLLGGDTVAHEQAIR